METFKEKWESFEQAVYFDTPGVNEEHQTNFYMGAKAALSLIARAALHGESCGLQMFLQIVREIDEYEKQLRESIE